MRFEALYADNAVTIENPRTEHGQWGFMILHQLGMLTGASIATHIRFDLYPQPTGSLGILDHAIQRGQNAVDARAVVDGIDILETEVFPRLRIMNIPDSVITRIKESMFKAFNFESVEKAKEFLEAERVAIKASFSPQRKGGRS